MLKETVSVEDVCDLLNEMLAMDCDCVQHLMSARIKCNAMIADHPTIQVKDYAEDAYPRVGLLGVLNGLFGIREDGMGALCMEVSEDNKIESFKPTP